MSSLELTVTLRRDGYPVTGFPVTRRIEVDEIQSFKYEKAADNDSTTFAAVPADQIATIQALLLRTSKAVTLRLDGQTDAGIALNAGGMIVILDCTIDAGAGASNCKINNPDDADTALIEGLAAGT